MDPGQKAETTMSTFTISTASTDFGTFDGETPAHALAAMHRAAGYASKAVDGVVIPPASAVDADGVSLCPGIDDVTITELVYAGADITVSTDGIDPQGLGSDEECAACEEHILDAVREAFPGATVRAVSRGGRTGGVTRDGEDISDEVKAVVTQAFDSFEWPAEAPWARCTSRERAPTPWSR